MRGRTLAKLGASAVAAVAAVVLMAAPASAQSDAYVVQYTSADTVYSHTFFEAGGCLGSNDEIVTIFDNFGGFGTEAHLYVRANYREDWRRVATVRAWDDTVEKCVAIREGLEVKLSSWKYNGSDKWSRKSDYGVA